MTDTKTFLNFDYLYIVEQLWKENRVMEKNDQVCLKLPPQCTAVLILSSTKENSATRKTVSLTENLLTRDTAFGKITQ